MNTNQKRYEHASFQNLHEKALQIAKSYLRAESELIEVLQIIDQCRGYREAGYKSLFEYTTQALKLSESVAYNLITVARKSREIPVLQEKIKSCEISLSNARAIAPVLTRANQGKWLSAASTLSKRELEKEIVREHPELRLKDREKYIAEERLELRIGVSEKLHQKLKRAQDLASSKNKKAASLEETLEALVEAYLEKEDPLRKAERVWKSKEASPNKVPKSSRYIPAPLKHEIYLRDQAQCTHEQNGKRCSERRWLDIHHILPRSRGGSDTPENLTTLCKGHHQVLHARGDHG